MRYFFDTEFNEDGKTIELISIGVVCEDGREYYACNSELNLKNCNPWVQANVLPHLPPFNTTCKHPIVGKPDMNVWIPRSSIAERIKDFVKHKNDKSWGDSPEAPEFWAYFADYDWVVFCQLFGRMLDLPKGFPMYCRDIKQLMMHMGVVKDQLPKQKGTEHDALADAHWNFAAWKALEKYAKEKFPGLRL